MDMSKDVERKCNEMFNIDVSNMYWITEGDDPNDLCAHGDMVAIIGDEKFEFSGTVSATAIYLLKTLTENRTFEDENQMMPCCGHFYIANDTLDNVIILGCNRGVDWETTHVDNGVKIKTENEKEVFVPYEEYKRVVFNFCDKVEAFYKSCLKKNIPDDEFERNGYIAFWNEWNRRRYGK